MKSDTIAAIASGMTASGIGIIRISGPEAFVTAARFIRLANKKPLSEMTPNTVRLGAVFADGKKIDEALILLMKAPHTYTAEDTVEIDCHGGPYVMKKVLDCALKNGARMAEPGEFTKRAFLNGRIDLSEAEAVMDLIGARNEAALKSSASVLTGSLRREITEIRAGILEHTARIEAALDDPEQNLLGEEEEGQGTAEEQGRAGEQSTAEEQDRAEEPGRAGEQSRTGKRSYREMLEADLISYKSRIDRLLASRENGRFIREGIRTVILGKPNTGKSTLLNLLSGEDRAIVTEIAGTTRDTLEETVNLDGLTLSLADTAGIRRTDEPIEKIGVGRAKKAAGDADLILYVTDSSVPLDENDAEILDFLHGRKAIVLLNKTDLPPVVREDEIAKRTDAPILSISAREGTGIRELAAKIREMFFGGEISLNEEKILINARQTEALTEAGRSLENVLRSLRGGLPEDFLSIDLTDAYASLGRILGEEVGDDVVREIFAKFCMGK